MKLVIDTNTLVSGTLWSGLPSRLLEALEKKRATLVLSADLLAEFADVVGQSVCRSCFWIFDATKLWNADAIKAERVIDRVGVCKQSVAGDQGGTVCKGCQVVRFVETWTVACGTPSAVNRNWRAPLESRCVELETITGEPTKASG